MILVSTTIFLHGCATIHKSNWAEPTTDSKADATSPSAPQEIESSSYPSNHNTNSFKSHKTKSGVRVSYELNKPYSSKHFRYFAFAFENDSDDWIKIDKIGFQQVSITENSQIFFLQGAPLESYLHAKTIELQVIAQNNAAMAGALAGIAASTSNSSASTGLYQNYATGLIAASAIQGATANSQKIDSYPEDHLFGSKERFLIPPKMIITKYLIFYSPNEKSLDILNTFKLSYDLKNGINEKLELDLSRERYYTSNSSY